MLYMRSEGGSSRVCNLGIAEHVGISAINAFKLAASPNRPISSENPSGTANSRCATVREAATHAAESFTGLVEQSAASSRDGVEQKR